MPAPGQINPTALPARIRGWLTEHYVPGAPGHRARDVAAGLGIPPDTTRADWSANVARALGRMVKDGTVVRTMVDLGHKNPVGLYAAAPNTEETSA